MGEAPGTGCWVYGVVPGDAPGPEGWAGVDERGEVELERHAGLAAVTSAVPLDEYGAEPLMAALEDLERVEALARAHERVVEDARVLAGTVVPFRLCTIYSGREQVREMLEREHATLAAALERLRGRTEWGVKAYTVPRAGAEPEPDEANGGGAAYLQRRIAKRDAAEAAWEAVSQATQDIHAQLALQAVDAALGRPQDRRLTGREGEMVLNASYLVADEDADHFRELVAGLAARHVADGVELELTGPWPPYHFVAEPATA